MFVITQGLLGQLEVTQGYTPGTLVFPKIFLTGDIQRNLFTTGTTERNVMVTGDIQSNVFIIGTVGRTVTGTGDVQRNIRLTGSLGSNG